MTGLFGDLAQVGPVGDRGGGGGGEAGPECCGQRTQSGRKPNWALLTTVTQASEGLFSLVRCDSGYQGLAKRAANLRLEIEIVQNPSRHQFIPVRHRWVVERSLAWLSAHRRLGKRDLEHTIAAAETWIKIAAIASMLDRLAPKPGTPNTSPGPNDLLPGHPLTTIFHRVA